MRNYHALDCLPVSKTKYDYHNGISQDFFRTDGFFSVHSPTDKPMRALQHKLANYPKVNTLFGTCKKLSDDPFVYLNPVNGFWTAGRYVGKCTFTDSSSTYSIEIKPRFGDKVLNWLILQSLGIRISPSLGKLESKREYIHNIILAYLWLHYLAKANRYGMPRVKRQNRYKGKKIRERLDVKSSIISFKTEREVVSTYHTKELDSQVLRLLKLTHDHLEKNRVLAELEKSESAKDVIREINSLHLPRKRFTNHDFKSIRLRSVYQEYQKVINLSWNILRGSVSQELEDVQEDLVLNTLVDIAEVWESFLREALRSKLQEKDWHLYTNDIYLYSDSEPLERSIIPDIVFTKGNKAIVLDAKYKLMRGRKEDLDRSDFFQIHTYMSYFIEQGYDVIGGLIYPLTIETSSDLDTKSYNLLGSKKKKSKIFVEGMKLDFETEDSKELANYLNDEKKGLVDRLLEKVSE